MTSAEGTSGGAGTVVNAMATGLGAAFGLAFEVQARVVPTDGPTRVRSNGQEVAPPEDALVSACLRLATGVDAHGGFDVEITSNIPQKKGLKSSSAVSVAVLKAVLRATGNEAGNGRVLDLASQAGLDSGTSLTGAYDDAAACLLGGLVLTDNAQRRIVAQQDLPAGLVALVHVPDGQRASGSYTDDDFRAIRPQAQEAFRLARAGDVPGAMRANTQAYAPVFGVETDFVDRALEAGAWAAGLSGTGPAQVALAAPEALDAVAGLDEHALRVPVRRSAA